MHTIFFKENEGIFADPNITGSQQVQVPLWGVMGSQPPPPPAAAVAAAYDNQFLQLAVAKEPDQVLAKKDTTHFTVFPGDCKTAENGAKTTYQGQLKLGFGQPQICVQYPYNAQQCYGLNSAYGAQIELYAHGRCSEMGQRIMLPLSMASDGGPILVNAKQYHGIMRRRRLRAKAESKNQEMKIRKPYMHVSRHLHAVRRQRGSSGRFLSTKSSNTNTMSDEKEKAGKRENHQQPQSTESQVSEVLQSDGRIHSTKTKSSSKSTSPASEVTSYLHHFEFDRLPQPSFRPFLDVGIADKYLKV